MHLIMWAYFCTRNSRTSSKVFGKWVSRLGVSHDLFSLLLSVPYKQKNMPLFTLIYSFNLFSSSNPIWLCILQAQPVLCSDGISLMVLLQMCSVYASTRRHLNNIYSKQDAKESCCMLQIYSESVSVFWCNSSFLHTRKRSVAKNTLTEHVVMDYVMKRRKWRR